MSAIVTAQRQLCGGRVEGGVVETKFREGSRKEGPDPFASGSFDSTPPRLVKRAVNRAVRAIPAGRLRVCASRLRALPFSSFHLMQGISAWWFSDAVVFPPSIPSTFTLRCSTLRHRRYHLVLRPRQSSSADAPTRLTAAGTTAQPTLSPRHCWTPGVGQAARNSRCECGPFGQGRVDTHQPPDDPSDRSSGTETPLSSSEQRKEKRSLDDDSVREGFAEC